MTQPIGEPVPAIAPSPPLARTVLEGEMVRLRPPHPEQDTASLYPRTHGSEHAESVWIYMGYGPFPDPEAMRSWIVQRVASPDPLWFTVSDRDDRAIGMAAMMNADPDMRRLELGHIWYVPEIHGTGANTEASFLMLTEAFASYRCRRVEWKCDSLNARSRRAALRLGFSFEGVFRNHMIVKGRNRDTAWYSMIDQDWVWVRSVLEEWVAKADPKPSLTRLMTLAREMTPLS